MIERDEPAEYCGCCGERIDEPSAAHCQGCYDAVCGFCRVGSICLDCEAEEREPQKT